MKVAVIGTGFGKHAAAPAYQSLGFDVEIVSPRDDSAVQKAIASNADLISVHSPPFMHVNHVTAAIEHGHAVLCDKPFGRNVDEAQQMRECARAAGTLGFLNFEFRFNDSWSRLKELADTGTIGAPTHLSLTFFGSGLRGRKYGWINDRELGGGWIGAYGSHLIDFTRWLLGSEVADCGGVTRIEEPEHLDADGLPRTATAEDAYSAWFVMENGCTAVHDTAFAAAVPATPRATLMGSAGSIELIGDTQLVVRRAGEAPETIEFPAPPRKAPPPALSTFFGKVAEALRTGTQITPSFDDGVAVAHAMDRLRAAAS
ncbi:Gfo/Idh/MocA family oxidoreductase [Mycobacterium barrassiae]|uniref:Gfo/Idh/MocA family protein n=1 Tax=Mycobacterium barrassiae TaxID=319709 RepID=UPI002265B422|nr:Gfo/Idh/MocA family oxidoreductase [Mycobacterium barrassiae]MCV7301009.1 Gfo/Idh/MocA family oxidoreductase [Mycobacterium barrassiae]